MHARIFKKDGKSARVTTLLESRNLQFVPGNLYLAAALELRCAWRDFFVTHARNLFNPFATHLGAVGQLTYPSLPLCHPV